MKTQNKRRPRRSGPRPKWIQRKLVVGWLPEPNLVFREHQMATDPKEGLSLYGPYGLSSGEHPERIRVGFVGSEGTIAQAKEWLKRCSHFIAGAENKRRQHPDFPGFNKDTAFDCEFGFNQAWENPISQRDLASLVQTRDKVQGFETAVDLFASRVGLLSDLGATDVIVCALPQEVEDYYSSIGPAEVRESASAQTNRIARAIHRIIRDAETRGQSTFLQQLFPDELEPTPTLLSRNFRRALKAKTNRVNCPVQIMRHRSLVEDDPTAQDPATRAWNMIVAMYFKARGLPWQVDGLDPNACYIGISFYHHITEESHTIHSSLAQLFTAHGDGLILRGDKFEWDPDQQGRSPHLTEDYALDLVSYILKMYYDYKGIHPRRVVIHKTSKFWDEERRGLESGLAQSNIAQYDLVSIDQTGTRFFREGDYPPIRGTWSRLGSHANWLYTLGYLPTQGTYPRPYIPKPLQIMDKYGDSTIDKILLEILALTKMNWNSADYASSFPITLHFARKVGEILTYLPDDVEPNPSFRFYC
jgi:hypothetical protein